MTTLRMLTTYAIIPTLGLALSSSFVTGVYAASPHAKGGADTISYLHHFIKWKYECDNMWPGTSPDWVMPNQQF